MLDCQSCENCGGCYDEGTKEPKLLSSCHHTLCLQCIKDIMAKSGLFTCPFCSKTYPNIKQPAIFPTNLFIANSIFAKNHKKRKLNNNGDFVKTEATAAIPEGGQKQESVSCSNMPSSSENSRESNAIQDAPKTAESLHNSDSNNSAEQNNNNNNNNSNNNNNTNQLLKDSNENSLDQLLECKEEILTTEQNLDNQDKKIEKIEKTLHRANNSSFSQPKQPTMTRQLLIDRAFESINSHSNPHSSHSNPHSSNQTLTSKIPTTIQSKDQSYLQSIQHSKAPSQSISIMASPLKCIPLSLCSAPHSYGSPPRPSRILFQSQENHTHHHPRNPSPRPSTRNNRPSTSNHCPDHSELLRYFCESHESSFCFRCHQHSFCGGVSLLETFSNDQMQKLYQLSEEGGAALSGLSSLAGHYRSIQDDLSDNLTSQIDKIENTFQQFIAKILRKKETIIQTIKTSTERVKQQVSMRINVVQSAITQCQRTNHQTLQIRSLLKKDRFIVASQAKQLNSATSALHTALNQLQKQFTQFTGQTNKDSQDIPKQTQSQSSNITQKQSQNQQIAQEKNIVQPSTQQLSLLQSLRMEQMNNSQTKKNEFKQPLTRPQYSRNIATNIEPELEENSESTDEYSKRIQSIALSSFSEFASNLLSDSREISKQFLSKVPMYSGTPSHPFDVTFQSQPVMVSAH